MNAELQNELDRIRREAASVRRLLAWMNKPRRPLAVGGTGRGYKALNHGR